MQNKLLSVLLAATVVTCGVRAQDTTNAAPPPAPPTAPTSAPAPVVNQAPAPAVSPAPAPVVTQTAPAPDQVIYSPRLPTVGELTNVASAQGLTIQQVNQTATQVTVIYKSSAGQVSTVAYQLLPTGTQVTQPTTVVVPSTPPPVVYAPAPPPRVVYYESYSDPFYDPFYDPFWPSYYPPVSMSFGFGYYHGWGGHHHHWR